MALPQLPDRTKVAEVPSTVPQTIRVDNGPEAMSRSLDPWASFKGMPRYRHLADGAAASL
jgi:hypothetical protein